jgi:Ca2+-transporting ATPase
MPGSTVELKKIRGLSSSEILALRQRFGKNIFRTGPSNRFLHTILNIVKEPMIILLLVGCSLYFFLGENTEGFLMLGAMAIVTAIAIYQDIKSTNAIDALKQFTGNRVVVIRDSREMTVMAENLVPGDIILLDEGMTVPADAIVVQQNDLSVNESIITGESVPADKDETEGKDFLYQGTTINSGKCIARVTAIGNNTTLGNLGKSIDQYEHSKTLLQIQLNRFVRLFALFGLLAFLAIFIVNYLHYGQWTTGLLFALTLAMSAIPEEIPVAFSSFMALGAYKMSKHGIISRQPQVIESLGAVSVFCFDKTGTLTENKMVVKNFYHHDTRQVLELSKGMTQAHKLLRYAVLASETNPFDAMEKAIWEAWHWASADTKDPLPALIHEYPLEGKPPMMTHVYGYGTANIVVSKGAAERILRVCRMSTPEAESVTKIIDTLAAKGYRVIGIASAVHNDGGFPVQQDDFSWKFEGLLALYDPPKKNAGTVLEEFYKAGIHVKLITGDHPATAVNIANQVGIRGHDKCLTGEQVYAMSSGELRSVVNSTNIYARMFPEAKLKVIEALRTNKEIVAMTGDGVNDGPALKSANIGIAMGKKGTDIAQQAADLILTDDNLESLVTAVSEGRKIFSNLKKAIRYIISIHIPIILIASLPLILGWTYPNIFTPIHIIFLELIMGPTCSIFFEREPVEGNLMQGPPRKRNTGIFSRSELLTSTIQGLVIAIAILSLYYVFMNSGTSQSETRTIVFTTLILANFFLTFTNRSFTETFLVTRQYKNKLVPFIIGFTIIFLLSIHFIPWVRNTFLLSPINGNVFWICFAVALACVLWFELYKAIKRRK